MIQQTIFGSAVWLAVGLLGVGLVLWRRALYLLPMILVAGLFIGLWRGSILQSQLVVYQHAIGHVASVQGTVSDDPDIGKSGELLMRLTHVAIDDHEVAG